MRNGEQRQVVGQGAGGLAAVLRLSFANTDLARAITGGGRPASFAT